jgi:hypothetical protein
VTGLAPSQLERIVNELDNARRRAHDIAAPLTSERWSMRPALDQWSVAECLIHLNLTSEAFLPLISDAIIRGRALKLFASGPFRRDIVGWFVHWITEPPVRVRVRTTAPFVPSGVEPKDSVLNLFDTLQARLVSCLHDAAGLDLGRLRITSPFDSRLRYNLYSCLRILPAHQRHHLAQAEEAIRSLTR